MVEHLHKRLVGHRCIRAGAAHQHCHTDVTQSASRLGHKPRLAHPRLTPEEQDLAAPALHLRPQPLQHFQLSSAADERRPAAGLQPSWQRGRLRHDRL